MNAALPPPRVAGRARLATEIAVTAVTATLAVCTQRLFTRPDGLLRLLAVVAIAHVGTAVVRRRKIRAVVAIPALLALGVITLTLLYFRDTSLFGLPTGRTAEAVVHDLRVAFRPFRRLVAPVDPAAGFQFALAASLWVMATFADTATFRAAAPVQAVIPATASFLFVAVLAIHRHDVASAGAFGAALALLAVAWNTEVGAKRRWTTGDAGIGTAAIARTGVALAVLGATAGGMLAAVAHPGTDGAVVDLRRLGTGGQTREVSNPLVDVGALLGERSDAVMFNVASPTPHYWRLTALEHFDGEAWSSAVTYSRVGTDGDLGAPGSDQAAERQEIAIENLVSNWLPTAYRPRSIGIDPDNDGGSDGGVRVHLESGSLLLNAGESTSRGFRYTVISSAPSADNAGGLGAGGDLPPADLDSYLTLPADFPDIITRQAGRIVNDAATPLEQAQALQSFFRDGEFRYSAEVDYRASDRPMLAFLAARSGFCQQFASTFAAMARAIGLPARVAVGFTYGDRTAAGTFTVRGRHAHAWPEVWIEGAGWLAFEPTPGRGNPDATQYTGVEPDQAGATTTTTTAAATTTTTTTTIAGATTTAPSTTVPTTDPTRRSDDGATPGPLVALLVIVGVAGLLAAAAAARVRQISGRRRPRPDAPAGERVERSWRHACRDLQRVGIRSLATETPAEFAGRAGRLMCREPLQVLAQAETHRRYAHDAPTADVATEAEGAAAQIWAEVGAGLKRSARVRAALGW